MYPITNIDSESRRSECAELIARISSLELYCKYIGLDCQKYSASNEALESHLKSLKDRLIVLKGASKMIKSLIMN